jgi:hypothetical protein
MRRIPGAKVFPVTLGQRERTLLDIIANREDRYVADVIRIAIREAAEKRGIRVEPKPEQVR